MDTTVAIVLVFLLLAVVAAWLSCIAGSAACALAGLRPGPWARTRLGLLGVVLVAALFAGLRVRPPTWMVWISASLLAAGVVVLARRGLRARASPG